MKLLMREYPTWLFPSRPFSISASASPWRSLSASTSPRRSFSTSTSSATAVPGRRFLSATVGTTAVKTNKNMHFHHFENKHKIFMYILNTE